MSVQTLARRLLRNRDGSVAIISATFGAVAVACLALAVDMGSVFMQSRKLQGMADLAAIAAARDLGAAKAAADATVAANSWAGVTVDVTTGVYATAAGTPRDQRFKAGSPTPNAVKVRLNADADLYFANAILGKNTLKLHRNATAARAEFASFSIGSRLASLDGGVANSLLGALIGGKVSLSVMDQKALVGADVGLFEYVDALRTRANLQAASFDKTLESDITTGQALGVLGDVLTANGDASAAAAVKKLAATAGNGTKIDLAKVFDLGPIGAQDHVLEVNSAKVNLQAMDVAGALLLVAQEGRQVKLNMGASIPGLTDIDVWLGIGERPNGTSWLAMSSDGEIIISTVQTRLYIEAQALSVLGALGATPLTLPILIEAAPAEAKLVAISCPVTRADQKVTLSVKPSVGFLAIGKVDPTKLNDFKHPLVVAPAALIDLWPLEATASAKVTLGGALWKPVQFSQAEIASNTIKSVKTTDVAQATLSSLLGSLAINIKLLGLSAPTLGVPLASTLKGLGAPLDAVVNELTDLLGVKLGEADVQVNGLRCRDAALVA